MEPSLSSRVGLAYSDLLCSYVVRKDEVSISFAAFHPHIFHPRDTYDMLYKRDRPLKFHFQPLEDV